MQPYDSPEEAAFRSCARGWLEQNARLHSSPPIAPSAIVAEWTTEEEEDKLRLAREWQRRKFEEGWAGVAWPSEFGGRGGSPVEQIIFDQEESDFDVPRDALIVGLGWCGPALLYLGNQQQRDRYIKPLLAGDEVWCQLFSEPGAGSDLAALTTRAIRDGEEWVIEGQKVWTTFAHLSDWGLCIARTDPDQPKHKGLSAFVVDMSSSGVGAKPMRQMTGAANFNEVFLDGVRVPDSNRVGEVGDGWRVVITTFMFERMGVLVGRGSMLEASRRLLPGSRRTSDDWVRNWIQGRVLAFTALRQLTAISKGQIPGPEGSVGKLMGTLILSDLYGQAVANLGPAGMLAAGDAPDDGEWQDAFLGTPGLRIGGGTDQIQRNIIAERVLGLPKDPPPEMGFARA
ncbi:MAG TPA: acyl-CoA dehydrogenase family protein [Acidimicrobiia bacterium]|nr:acyl-CoA dehydrogenase family protein [Acidimicrobiia bacterium]